MQRVFSVEAAAAQLDYLVRNVRVLARATVGLNRLAPPPPPQLVRALRMTADAVRSVEQAMAADLAGDEEAASRHAEEATATHWTPCGPVASCSRRAPRCRSS